MPVWIDGGPRRSRRHRAARVLAFAAIPVLAIGGIVIDGPSSAPSAVVDAGPGDGPGMSQLGALGYARAGWTADQILAHYYGDTTMGRVDTNLPIIVWLTEQHDLDVYSAGGSVVGGHEVAPGQAVSINGTTATVTQGCGGTVVASFPAPDATVHPVSGAQNLPANDILHFCGSNLGYRGALTAKGGNVYNTVGIEDYVRGVVPAEMSAGWANSGGYEALRAQAIAARSYALVRGAARGDQFEDTQNAQVYAGTSKEDPRTDQAVASTAGLVMSRNGVVYETDFKATNGDDATGVPVAVQATQPGAVVSQPAAGPVAQAAQTVNALNPVPTAPNAAQVAPAAGGSGGGAVPVASVPQVVSAPTMTPAEALSTASSAIAQAYQGAGGPGGKLGNLTGTPIMLPGASAMFQSYDNGTILWTPAAGAQVIPSGVAAPATLMNWVTAFASGGTPQLPNLPLLNLIPGWGGLLGLTPGGKLFGAPAPTTPGPGATPGAIPKSGAPTVPGAAAPTTTGAPAPAAAKPAAPAPPVSTTAPR